MSCSTVFRLHGGPHLTHLVYQSPFIFNNHRWRYMETSVFLALLPFLFDGHFTSNSKRFYSTKLVTSEHNFPVNGQVSLFTMPADLKQTNPFCDFIVGILISTEHSHAPLGHHHPIRNISLLHHHTNEQGLSASMSADFMRISTTFIEVVIGWDVGQGRLGSRVPAEGVAVFCLDEGCWGRWRQFHLHYFILLRQEGIIQELA